MHRSILDYIENNKDRFLSELMEMLRIPSVSADPTYKTDVFRMAEDLANRFRALGLDEVELLQTPGFPVVYAEKLVDPAKPTILVYGHYDVQPPDPIELWHSGPFEPDIRDEKIYARGACDDKGQMYMHAKAVETLLNTTGLPCNVKFFVEGEEEVGSLHLEEAIRTHAEKIAADIVLISDTSMLANDTPSISVGLRGLCYMEVEVVGPNRDLHSGTYGGAVGNPLNTLCEMIAKLKDADGRVTIPGFYDDVAEPTPEESTDLAKVPFNLSGYKMELGVNALYPETGYTPPEQTSIRPSCDVNGIWGGYTGEGAKTVLPSKANAKISMRLVPGQEPKKIAQLFIDYWQQLAPPYVRVKATEHHGGLPFLTDTSGPGYRAAERAYEASFGKKPIPTREGGSIPITANFVQILQKPVVLMGFGLDTDAIHSPNEHFGIFNYLRGIETLSLFHHFYMQEAAHSAATQHASSFISSPG